MTAVTNGRDTVAEIKDRLPIQDIIAPYVKLNRAGRSLRGLCPFHKEKTPSLHVSPERGTWHCFGCGIGGDGFSFIEKIEGVDFKGALKLLAEKAGVRIEYARGSRERSERNDRLRELLSRASAWYASRLPGSPAESYAKKRGLSETTIRDWELGYSPEGWRTLLDAMTVEGFSVHELLAAGLIKEADGKPGTFYDRFRNRLLFPIRDSAGRVVAFTGRALGDDLAKYLNSPETELYHKSEILFGLDRAKDAIRTRGYTLLVEGQLDVLLAHQADFKNTVALSGTALTKWQIGLIKRFSDNLLLVLDADPAGMKATARSAALALESEMRVKAARLPEGRDPADLISSGATSLSEFSARLASAKHIIEHFLSELAEQESDPHRLVRAAEAVVLPLLHAIKSPMEREHFTQVSARALGLSPETIRETLNHIQSPTERADSPSRTSNDRPVRVASPTRSAREIRTEQLLAVIRAYPNTPLAERASLGYCRITGAVSVSADVVPERAVFEAELSLGESPEADAADELLRAFERAVVREAYQTAVMALRRAEQCHNEQAVHETQATCVRLSQYLADLSAQELDNPSFSHDHKEIRKEKTKNARQKDGQKKRTQESGQEGNKKDDAES